ncbi:MAG: adenylate/guanylate cyclase domain-containing protein [Myxococcota bacterium]|nr:adenylate/guanylate cyclase domain-containing protein [Myxococcota bacterium]
MRTSFRVKIALLTIGVAALPLALVGWLLIDVNAREVESSSQALQIALTEQVAAAVDGELRRARTGLSAIGNALTDGSLGEEARLATALRLLDANESLEVVAVYDAEGALIDRMGDPSARGIETPDALSAALRERGLGEATEGESVRVLVVERLSAAGRATGWVASPVSLAPVQARVAELSRAQLASRRGRVMVVDEAGRALVHPDASLRLSTVGAPPATLSRAPSSSEVDGWLRTAAATDAAPWAVITEIPREVAYASLAEMRAIVIGTILGTLLLAVIASLLLARRLAAPIATLVAFTQELSARRFDRRVSIETGDELAVLGDALSDAAAELERSEEAMRREQAIRADLGRYLPAELVEAIIRREASMELGGQRREITVLFADVVAFTPLSDRLPPEQVVSLLNELFTLLTGAVFRHEGTVDKFIGDCVMAIWGAPTAQPDHAARALAAARDMMRFLESANAAWRESVGVEIQLAIGVHTGEAVVGNVGSETRMEYTAIGDVVNVAARLETIARPQQILVTRATAEAAGRELPRVGEREVPGRAQKVELFEAPW